MCHVSHVMCHVSPVICPVSPVTNVQYSVVKNTWIINIVQYNILVLDRVLKEITENRTKKHYNSGNLRKKLLDFIPLQQKVKTCWTNKQTNIAIYRLNLHRVQYSENTKCVKNLITHKRKYIFQKLFDFHKKRLQPFKTVFILNFQK